MSDDCKLITLSDDHYGKNRQVIITRADLSDYWREGSCLVVAFLSFLIGCYLCNGSWGNICVALSVVAQFINSNRMIKKTVLNSARARDGDFPAQFSDSWNRISYISIIFIVLGTLLAAVAPATPINYYYLAGLITILSLPTTIISALTTKI